MVISLAVSVCGKFKSLCVCPSLRMHVSIRFWQASLVFSCFASCFVSFLWYQDALVYAMLLVGEIDANGACPAACTAIDRGESVAQCARTK